MKCNEKGFDDRYCCPSGERYDATSQQCVIADTEACRTETCPAGFTVPQGGNLV